MCLCHWSKHSKWRCRSKGARTSWTFRLLFTQDQAKHLTGRKYIQMKVGNTSCSMVIYRSLHLCYTRAWGIKILSSRPSQPLSEELVCKDTSYLPRGWSTWSNIYCLNVSSWIKPPIPARLFATWFGGNLLIRLNTDFSTRFCSSLLEELTILDLLIWF